VQKHAHGGTNRLTLYEANQIPGKYALLSLLEFHGVDKFSSLNCPKGTPPGDSTGAEQNLAKRKPKGKRPGTRGDRKLSASGMCRPITYDLPPITKSRTTRGSR